METMEIREYTYVDIHYTLEESNKAKMEGDELIKNGFELSAKDVSGKENHVCDQYIKYKRPFIIK